MRDRGRTIPKSSRNNSDFEQTGAKSGAIHKNPDDWAAILVAIADLPAEQKQALAKLLASVAVPDKLP